MEKNNKSIIYILIVIIVLLALVLGGLVYKNYMDKDDDKNKYQDNIDNDNLTINRNIYLLERINIHEGRNNGYSKLDYYFKNDSVKEEDLSLYDKVWITLYNLYGGQNNYPKFISEKKILEEVNKRFYGNVTSLDYSNNNSYLTCEWNYVNDNSNKGLLYEEKSAGCGGVGNGFYVKVLDVKKNNNDIVFNIAVAYYSGLNDNGLQNVYSEYIDSSVKNSSIIKSKYIADNFKRYPYEEFDISDYLDKVSKYEVTFTSSNGDYLFSGIKRSK